jgi:hypothetical protein
MSRPNSICTLPSTGVIKMRSSFGCVGGGIGTGARRAAGDGGRMMG